MITVMVNHHNHDGAYDDDDDDDDNDDDRIGSSLWDGQLESCELSEKSLFACPVHLSIISIRDYDDDDDADDVDDDDGEFSLF